MAMVKTTADFPDLEGKSGGDRWRKDQCGQHWEAEPGSWDRTPSEEQLKIRNCMRSIWYFFEDETEWPYHPQELLDEVIAAWKLFAWHYKEKSKKGKSYVLTWYQAYTAVNMKNCLAGEPLELKPTPGTEI